MRCYDVPQWTAQDEQDFIQLCEEAGFGDEFMWSADKEHSALDPSIFPICPDSPLDDTTSRVSWARSRGGSKTDKANRAITDRVLDARLRSLPVLPRNLRQFHEQLSNNPNTTISASNRNRTRSCTLSSASSRLTCSWQSHSASTGSVVHESSPPTSVEDINDTTDPRQSSARATSSASSANERALLVRADSQHRELIQRNISGHGMSPQIRQGTSAKTCRSTGPPHPNNGAHGFGDAVVREHSNAHFGDGSAHFQNTYHIHSRRELVQCNQFVSCIAGGVIGGAIGATMTTLRRHVSMASSTASNTTSVVTSAFTDTSWSATSSITSSSATESRPELLPLREGLGELRTSDLLDHEKAYYNSAQNSADRATILDNGPYGWSEAANQELHASQQYARSSKGLEHTLQYDNEKSESADTLVATKLRQDVYEVSPLLPHTDHTAAADDDLNEKATVLMDNKTLYKRSGPRTTSQAASRKRFERVFGPSCSCRLLSLAIRHDQISFFRDWLNLYGFEPATCLAYTKYAAIAETTLNNSACQMLSSSEAAPACLENHAKAGLLIGAWEGNQQLIEKLLSDGVYDEDDTRHVSDYDALIAAAYAGHRFIVRRLLRASLQGMHYALECVLQSLIDDENDLVQQQKAASDVRRHDRHGIIRQLIQNGAKLTDFASSAQYQTLLTLHRDFGGLRGRIEARRIAHKESQEKNMVGQLQNLLVQHDASDRRNTDYYLTMYRLGMSYPRQHDIHSALGYLWPAFFGLIQLHGAQMILVYRIHLAIVRLCLGSGYIDVAESAVDFILLRWQQEAETTGRFPSHASVQQQLEPSLASLTIKKISSMLNKMSERKRTIWLRQHAQPVLLSTRPSEATFNHHGGAIELIHFEIVIRRLNLMLQEGL